MVSMTLAIRIDVPFIGTNADNSWRDVSTPDLYTFLKTYTSLVTPN